MTTNFTKAGLAVEEAMWSAAQEQRDMAIVACDIGYAVKPAGRQRRGVLEVVTWN